MKFKVLTPGMMALIISFTLQVGASPLEVMSSDDLKVEVLPPDRGTAMLTAQRGENPVSGVEMKIDGESKGFTNEEGKLKIEWLLFGNHVWEAIYEGRRVSQGEFEIPKIVEIKILDRWLEVGGEKTNEFYPLRDTTHYVDIFQNTGTTIINRYVLGWEALPNKEMVEFKFIRPSIPSPLVGRIKGILIEMFFVSGGDEYIYKDGIATATDLVTRCPSVFANSFVLYSSQGEVIAEGVQPQKVPGLEGIAPGEILESREEGKYLWYIQESMRNKALEMGMEEKEIRMEILDEENGIMKIYIEEFKFGPIKLSNIEVIGRLKGSCGLKHKVYVDDKLSDSISFEDVWLSKESDKTLNELLR